MIFKAHDGLHSSGLQWCEIFFDTLCGMGFSPFKAEGNIWMRKNGNVYEHLATYVNDICIVVKDPGDSTRQRIETYGYKLKSAGPLKYHLGYDFFRYSCGTIYISPKSYIEIMKTIYERMFGSVPKPESSPISWRPP